MNRILPIFLLSLFFLLQPIKLHAQLGQCPTCKKAIANCPYKGKHPVEPKTLKVSFMSGDPSHPLLLFIDGVKKDSITAYPSGSYSCDLKYGTHSIMATAQDMEDYKETITVNKNTITQYSIKAERAFNNKSADHIKIIGDYYANGSNGRAKDIDEACLWYEKAAEMGNVSAGYTAGKILKNRRRNRDLEKSVELFRSSAKREHMDSQYELGQAYHYGLGIPKDSLLAKEWYEKAAKQGHANAQNNLAAIYYYANDYSSAYKWFKLAADQNNSTSLEWLVFMYENEDVLRDSAEAIDCYTKAASLYFESKKYERAFDVFSKAFSMKKNYRKKKLDTGSLSDARTILLKKYSSHFGTTIKEDPPYEKNEYILDLEKISSYALYAMKYEKAEEYAVEGIGFAPDNLKINSNLAVSLLLQGKFYEAEKIYRKFKNQNSIFFMNELKAFCKAVIVPKEKEADVEIIKKLLRE